MARSILALLASALCASAATVTYDFNVTWVRANPDGLFERSVMGINHQWPIPAIVVDKGDRVIVNLNNQLGNESTSLHFHGLFMNETTHMDGVVGVTQCAVPPGSSITYNFTVNQPGTYWYHSHVKAQYPDGLRGPLIVRDSDSPYKDQYDDEIVLTFSDWYHEKIPILMKQFLSVTNPTGAEPVPNSALMNDTQNLTVAMTPGKTYMFRLINMGAFAAHYVWFEGHTMRIVEVDGVYTESADADRIYMTAAQRYSVLITAKNDTGSNFAIVGSMDEDLFDSVPSTLNKNVTGWLVYNDTANKAPAALIDDYDHFDDFKLVPHDGKDLFDNVDHQITLDLKMDNLGDGFNYAFFNDITYVAPKVPTLYSVLSSGSAASNVSIYGSSTNSFILNKNEIVEIVINNNDAGKHPFHLHGHEFQVASRSEDDAGPYANNATMPQTPMRRDTILVRPNGNVVLRFRADNPGVWFFHCHIEWHVASGLIATMIEAPLAIQEQFASGRSIIPEDHWTVCNTTHTPTKGNAAGNTKDLFDLSGENKASAPLPAGFTPRGIVALVFSCVSAFVGMVAIGWYGMAPLQGAKVGEGAVLAEREEREGEK